MKAVVCECLFLMSREEKFRLDLFEGKGIMRLAGCLDEEGLVRFLKTV